MSPSHYPYEASDSDSRWQHTGERECQLLRKVPNEVTHSKTYLSKWCGILLKDLRCYEIQPQASPSPPPPEEEGEGEGAQHFLPPGVPLVERSVAESKGKETFASLSRGGRLVLVARQVGWNDHGGKWTELYQEGDTTIAEYWDSRRKIYRSPYLLPKKYDTWEQYLKNSQHSSFGSTGGNSAPPGAAAARTIRSDTGDSISESDAASGMSRRLPISTQWRIARRWRVRNIPDEETNDVSGQGHRTAHAGNAGRNRNPLRSSACSRLLRVLRREMRILPLPLKIVYPRTLDFGYARNSPGFVLYKGAVHPVQES